MTERKEWPEFNDLPDLPEDGWIFTTVNGRIAMERGHYAEARTAVNCMDEVRVLMKAYEVADKELQETGNEYNSISLDTWNLMDDAYEALKEKMG